MKLLKIILACLVFGLSQSMPAYADKDFDDRLKRMANSFNGCHKVRMKFRDYRKEYPEWYWAFAKQDQLSAKADQGVWLLVQQERGDGQSQCHEILQGKGEEVWHQRRQDDVPLAGVGRFGRGATRLPGHPEMRLYFEIARDQLAAGTTFLTAGGEKFGLKFDAKIVLATITVLISLIGQVV